MFGAISFDTKSDTHSDPYSDANTMHGQILTHAGPRPTPHTRPTPK